MKYKKGQKVRVREDLECEFAYGGYMWLMRMDFLKGTIVTIKEVLSNGYVIEEISSDIVITDKMLWPAEIQATIK